MLIRNTVLAATAALVLVACDSKEECTAEVAQQKASEMTAKIQELAASNPEKLGEAMGKAQEITNKIASNPEEACAAIDELLATLE